MRNRPYLWSRVFRWLGNVSEAARRRIKKGAPRRGWRGLARSEGVLTKRISLLRIFFVLGAVILIGRLFQLQVLEHRFYNALASGEHDIYQKLFPVRGEIFVRDRDGSLFPVAANRELYLIWADLRKIDNATSDARLLAPLLLLDEIELKSKIEPSTDPYVPLIHGISDEVATQIRELELPGIYIQSEPNRLYPEKGFSGQLLGFLGLGDTNAKGKYGLEGYYDQELQGQQGSIFAKRDPKGRLIAVATQDLKPAEDGTDLVLTIDRTVEFFVCSRLQAAVARHGAEGGSVVILEPKTGAVIAMCGTPDFDPNSYRSVNDISVFNNPALFDAYEPGSIFKAVTMAAALDTGAVSPVTTYNDEGEVVIGAYHIKNSDSKAHGIVTMTQVLEESLNTGAIFAMRQTGAQTFREYVERFGFGALSGIDLDTEVAGNISSLKQRGDIYPATASFGQGITTTPLQIAAAFAAMANGGKLMKPYVVDEIRKPNGENIKTQPEMRRQIISSRTAVRLGAMLVDVVENGHGKRAGVPGYYIGGKTGTAQIPSQDGSGYEANVTIGTFVGYGPIENPAFVMVVRIDRPKDVQFAESSAAPLFGEIAKFLLQYYHIPPTRPVK